MISFYLYNNFGNYVFSDLGIMILLAILNTIFYFLSTIYRVKSLDNMDTTLVFPLYKTFSPILITIISLFIFGESLNFKETLGIIVGIIVPLLLITKTENNIQKNLKLGIIFVIATSIFGAISNGFNKAIYNFEINVDLFVLLSLIAGTFISIFSYKVFDKKEKKLYSKKGIYKFGVLLGFFHFMSFYTFTLAVKGNLAIAYTINSFSILIPIILSVIFYKENMTYKKAFVIFLSIISMLLFI
ncbi:MAG: EamA family transporter [Candidatus Gracilibacteria bacterium]|nr:EamA family transporter [Candidatus Gracilibacteria bacterium]